MTETIIKTKRFAGKEITKVVAHPSPWGIQRTEAGNYWFTHFLVVRYILGFRIYRRLRPARKWLHRPVLYLNQEIEFLA